MIQILSTSLFLLFLLFIVFHFISERYFPKKPKGFRLLVKKMGRIELYRIQVNRPFFGWTGFFVSVHSGNFHTYNRWSNRKSSELQYVKDYLELCGLDPKDYQVTEKKYNKEHPSRHG